jgi:hypothetical protein
MQLNLAILTILGSLTVPVLAMAPGDTDAAMVALFNIETSTPSAEILKGRLERSGFKELNDVTHLAVLLASQRLSIVSVAERVETAAQAYYMYKRDPILRAYLERRQSALFGAVLEHDPRALAVLSKCGLFSAPDGRK